MMPDVVFRLAPRQQATFKRAYDNAQRRPIGWWDPDDIAVGLVQAWLVFVGESLPRSTKIEPDGSIQADGIFGDETFKAVQSFQRKNKLKGDGMVGHDTLDAFREAIAKHRPTPPVQTTSEVIIIGTPPKPCPPGALICPDRF